MKDKRYESIVKKLDIYIKEYSNLLEENFILKEKIKEKETENNLLKKKIGECEDVIDKSKISMLNSIEKSEKLLQQTEQYKENVDLTFKAIGQILDIMIERDKISSKEIEILKDRIEELKKDLEQ
jgi:hypothetical protein